MESDQYRSERDILVEILRRFGDCSSSEELLEMFVESLSKLSRTSRHFMIWLVSDDGSMFEAQECAPVKNNGKPALSLEIKGIYKTMCMEEKPLVSESEKAGFLDEDVLILPDEKIHPALQLRPAMILSPFSVQGKVAGFISLSSLFTLNPSDLYYLEGLASLAGGVLVHLSSAFTPRDMYEEQKELADRDPMTGLLNHRRFYEVLDQVISRAYRNRSIFALVLLDIDDFKIINDTYGHLQGDRILMHVTRILRKNCRSMDHAGRYGGDEFTLILPETDDAGAHIVVTRIVSELAHQGVLLDSGGKIPIHISAGIATYPRDASSARDLVKCADTALYKSKNQEGFNLITLAHSVEAKSDSRLSLGVLEELIEAVDRKDHYTRLHSDIVCQCCERMADRLGLNSHKRDVLVQAALVHDIGKIMIPTSILKKPGSLSEEEYDEIKKHPFFGHTILKPLIDLDPLIREIVLYHHERVDGHGYPEGLKEDEIPYLARVLSVCDIYSAMIMDRPYRKGLPLKEVLKRIRKAAGTQIDGDLANVFIDLYKLDGRSEEAAPRIMVIDDDLSILELIQEVLRLEHYTVDIFSRSNEAIKAFDRTDYDVVLTDLNMPDVSGWEIVDRVKEKDTRVIIMTAVHTPELISTLKERQVFAVLIKPFSVLKIKNNIHAALQFPGSNLNP